MSIDILGSKYSAIKDRLSIIYIFFPNQSKSVSWSGLGVKVDLPVKDISHLLSEFG